MSVDDLTPPGPWELVLELLRLVGVPLAILAPIAIVLWMADYISFGRNVVRVTTGAARVIGQSAQEGYKRTPFVRVLLLALAGSIWVASIYIATRWFVVMITGWLVDDLTWPDRFNIALAPPTATYAWTVYPALGAIGLLAIYSLTAVVRYSGAIRVARFGLRAISTVAFVAGLSWVIGAIAVGIPLLFAALAALAGNEYPISGHLFDGGVVGLVMAGLGYVIHLQTDVIIRMTPSVLAPEISVVD